MDYHALACELLNIRGSQSQIRYEQKVSKLLCADIFVLKFVHDWQDAGEPVHPKDLSDAMMMSSARMAVILRHLEDKGYIHRDHDKQDNRQVLVTLSDKGRDTLENHRKEFVDYIERILTRMGDDAQEYVRLQKEFIRSLPEK